MEYKILVNEHNLKEMGGIHIADITTNKYWWIKCRYDFVIEENRKYVSVAISCDDHITISLKTTHDTMYLIEGKDIPLSDLFDLIRIFKRELRSV